MKRMIATFPALSQSPFFSSSSPYTAQFVGSGRSLQSRESILDGNALLHYHVVVTEGGNAMSTLTVTARGQVTFRKEVLQHLGIKPGEKIELDLMPDGRAELRAAHPKGSFRDLRGILKSKTNGARLSIEEINEAIAEAGVKSGAGNV
jgi:bifunctional DNA-binding transcriptional regulator/antitoxin component of YhaV-PrlF toxin-antitoxin module